MPEMNWSRRLSCSSGSRVSMAREFRSSELIWRELRRAINTKRSRLERLGFILMRLHRTDSRRSLMLDSSRSN